MNTYTCVYIYIHIRQNKYMYIMIHIYLYMWVQCVRMSRGKDMCFEVVLTQMSIDPQKIIKKLWKYDKRFSAIKTSVSVIGFVSRDRDRLVLCVGTHEW